MQHDVNRLPLSLCHSISWKRHIYFYIKLVAHSENVSHTFLDDRCFVLSLLRYAVSNRNKHDIMNFQENFL